MENEEKTVAMYTDDEKSTKLINVDTSEIEQSQDDFEQDDEYDDDDEIDEDDEYDAERIGLNDIRNAVRYAGNRQEAREALQNIEKWLEENGIEI